MKKLILISIAILTCNIAAAEQIQLKNGHYSCVTAYSGEEGVEVETLYYELMTGLVKELDEDGSLLSVMKVSGEQWLPLGEIVQYRAERGVDTILIEYANEAYSLSEEKPSDSVPTNTFHMQAMEDGSVIGTLEINESDYFYAVYSCHRSE